MSLVQHSVNGMYRGKIISRVMVGWWIVEHILIYSGRLLKPRHRTARRWVQIRSTNARSAKRRFRTFQKKKNADYGDAFANYGVVGVLVRMGDKIARLQSITTKCVNLINTESLRDTLIDLHNYSAMAIMLLDEEKKEEIKIPFPPPSSPI